MKTSRPKSYALIFKQITALLLLNWLFISSTAIADEQPQLELLYLNDYQHDQQLMLDGYIKYRLPESVQNALHHEIMLTFETQIQLLNKVHYLGVPYNREIKTIEYQTTLQYLTYNQTYYITNRRNNKVQAFKNLKDALATLGTLSSFYLSDLSDLYAYNSYHLKLRSQLDVWQLPTPLILDALIDSDWDLDSGWYSLNIKNSDVE